MFKIEQVTSDSLQQQTLILEDGSSLSLTIYFMPMQFGWFIRNLTYGDFVINNLRIVNTGNMLHQWKNKLPFGIACFSKENREPSQQEDFSSGNSELFILSESEVEDFEDFLRDG